MTRHNKKREIVDSIAYVSRMVCYILSQFVTIYRILSQFVAFCCILSKQTDHPRRLSLSGGYLFFAVIFCCRTCKSDRSRIKKGSTVNDVNDNFCLSLGYNKFKNTERKSFRIRDWRSRMIFIALNFPFKVSCPRKNWTKGIFSSFFCLHLRFIVLPKRWITSELVNVAKFMLIASRWSLDLKTYLLSWKIVYLSINSGLSEADRWAQAAFNCFGNLSTQLFEEKAVRPSKLTWIRLAINRIISINQNFDRTSPQMIVHLPISILFLEQPSVLKKSMSGNKSEIKRRLCSMSPDRASHRENNSKSEINRPGINVPTFGTQKR